MPADWQATAAPAAASKPVHDTSVRRQRPQSQGPVTVRKMKMQTQDHLDVSSSESRRSSGNSLPPSRSASQEARLHIVA
ncbi:unnamed protein product [Cylicostephanus goldi]|uniref:Uncharacterized protein n=1 Tax=Cylicostephanus goldi TaxID=71465 RepID=A0A3P7M8S4_CYLGO|nr:unnamed protein product [Cylicostephanus goldi]